jgi:alkylated DNA repair dioxygenase AlkB
VAGAVQFSLLDEVDDAEGIGPGELAGTVQRVDLGSGAWCDLRPGWVHGADELLVHLLAHVPWTAEQRPMYDRVVDVPRLAARYENDVELPHPAVQRIKDALDAHYLPEFGEPFASAGLALYRDGKDSVAWHGDTFGRGSWAETMVGIVVLGPPRPFLMRPRPEHAPPGPTRRYHLGHGDLIVMGGSCQRTWQHAVPKTARAAGPRISIQFRSRDVS